MKWKNFTATYIDGNKFVFSFRKNKIGGYWELKDYDNYVRTLEKTWIDSLQKIKLILDNYGMTANIN